MSGFPQVRIERLHWHDELLGSIDLPKAPLKLRQSFGSGLARRASEPPGLVWAVGDRGPNLKIKTLLGRYGAEHLRPLESLAGAKVMPRLDIGPRIAQLAIRDGRVDLIASSPVTDQEGRAVSGLPMPGSAHSISEPALSLDGQALAPDPSGLDSEGLVALDDGSFILSEEFGPSLVRLDGNGRVLARHVPIGVALENARYPVHQTLPSIAAKRQLNRGFEAIALSADQQSLFVAFQSPLAHPDEAAHAAARHVRLWRLDIAMMEVVAQYLYPLDAPDTFIRDRAREELGWSDLKVSEMVSLPDGGHLVLERASETTKVYRVQLTDQCALPQEHLHIVTRPTLEEASAQRLPLVALDKQLLFSSDDFPELSADLEGMTLLSPSELLLVNDNDFGVEGAETMFWKVTFAEPLFG